MTNQEAIVEAGFKPPSTELFKDDQRGREYGTYRARPVGGSSTRIAVTKHDARGQYHWSCWFEDASEFLMWAKDNT